MNNLSLDEIYNITSYLKLEEYSMINICFNDICKKKAGALIYKNIKKWCISLSIHKKFKMHKSRFYFIHFTPRRFRSKELLRALSVVNSDILINKFSQISEEIEDLYLNNLLRIGISDIEYLENIAFKYYDKFYISNLFKKNIFSFKNLNSDENIYKLFYSTIKMVMEFIDPMLGLVEDEINYISILLISAYSGEILDFIIRRNHFIFRREGWVKAIRSMHLKTFN